MNVLNKINLLIGERTKNNCDVNVGCKTSGTEKDVYPSYQLNSQDIVNLFSYYKGLGLQDERNRFHYIIKESFKYRIIDPDDFFLQFLNFASEDFHLIMMGIAVRAGTNVNAYITTRIPLGHGVSKISGGRVDSSTSMMLPSKVRAGSTIHILGFAYLLLSDRNTEPILFNRIIGLMILSGSKMVMPMTLGRPDISVKQWFEINNYGNFLSILDTDPKICFGQEAVNSFAIVLNNRVLYDENLPVGDAAITSMIKYFSDKILTTVPVSKLLASPYSTYLIDQRALIESINYLNLEAFTLFIKIGMRPSYALINKIVLEMMIYSLKHTKSILLPAESFTTLLSREVIEGIPIVEGTIEKTERMVSGPETVEIEKDKVVNVTVGGNQSTISSYASPVIDDPLLKTKELKSVTTIKTRIFETGPSSKLSPILPNLNTCIYSFFRCCLLILASEGVGFDDEQYSLIRRLDPETIKMFDERYKTPYWKKICKNGSEATVCMRGLPKKTNVNKEVVSVKTEIIRPQVLVEVDRTQKSKIIIDPGNGTVEIKEEEKDSLTQEVEEKTVGSRIEEFIVWKRDDLPGTFEDSIVIDSRARRLIYRLGLYELGESVAKKSLYSILSHISNLVGSSPRVLSDKTMEPQEKIRIIDEFSDAFYQKNKMTVNGRLGHIGEFMNGSKCSMIEFSNLSDFFPEHPYSYVYNDMIYYRDDQGLCWAWNCAQFQRLISEGRNPVVESQKLPQTLINEMKAKMTIRMQYFPFAYQSKTFKEVLLECLDYDMIKVDPYHEYDLISLCKERLQPYSRTVTYDRIKNLEKGKIEMILIKMRLRIMVISLSQPHAMRTFCNCVGTLSPDMLKECGVYFDAA